DVTRSFLTRLGRGEDWRQAAADEDATYDDQIELDLSSLTPLVALPGSPDRVVPVEEVAGTAVEQVMVGSCTNGSWHDMASVTDVIRGRHVHPSVSFVLFPGSHKILETMAREGLLTDLIAAGATVSESSCGACAGIGHVPAAGAKSLRAFNRNFSGRSGVKDDQVYLCSSVVAAASALTGVITDPRTLGAQPEAALPPRFASSAVGFVAPDGGGEIVRGPNIKPVPLGEPVAESLEAPVLLKLGDKGSTDEMSAAGSGGLGIRRGPKLKPVPLGEPVAESLEAPVLLKLGDKVSTDDISPAGSAVLVFRSNVPAIAEFCFKYVDAECVGRAKAAGRGIIVGGETYGQGSSREAAAHGPMFLGVRAGIAKSFARIPRTG